MEIVPLTPKYYAEWDAFCLAHDDAWFWHTTHWMDYTLDYCPDLDMRSLSFMLMENGQILAICPLLMWENSVGEDTHLEFSYGGAPVPAPALHRALSATRRDRLQKELFDLIDQLAEENGVSRITVRVSPWQECFFERGRPFFNYLLKYGYIDLSLGSQVIDLSQDLDALKKDMRKGHRYDIRKGLEQLDITVYDSTNCNREVFDCYQRMHAEQAGRSTRSSLTFDRMFSWISEGHALLVGAKFEDQFAGFSFLVLFHGCAFYASACNAADFARLPIAHALHWMTIAYLKERDIRFFEIGLQQFSAVLHDIPTEKERNISLFKRGFGGVTVPYFVGEKYYSHDLFQRVFQQRMQTYSAYLQSEFQGVCA